MSNASTTEDVQRLSHCREVKGKVLLELDTFEGDLDLALQSIQVVGGFQASGAQDPKTINVPRLTAIGSVDSLGLTMIENVAAINFNAPKLETIEYQLLVEGNKDTFIINMPSLLAVNNDSEDNGEGVIISANKGTVTFDAAKLTTIEANLAYSNNGFDSTLLLPELTTIGGDLSCSGTWRELSVDYFKDIFMDLPKLMTIGGSVRVAGTDTFTLDAPELTTISGSMSLDGVKTDIIMTLTSLSSIGWSLRIANSSTSVVPDFPALTTVGNFLSLEDNPSLTTVGFPLLQSIGFFYNASGNTTYNSLILPALTNIAGSFVVRDNPALCFDSQAFYNRLTPYLWTILNNKLDCDCGGAPADLAWNTSNCGGCDLLCGQTCDYGICVPPPLARPWKQVVAGEYVTVAIEMDGTLWRWGSSAWGSIQYIPVQIGTANNWSSVAVGGNHVVAVKTNGTLWAWGRNDMGQLGDGTQINHNDPAQVGAETVWAAVAAGDSHSMAMKTDGKLYGFGNGNNGELGAPVATIFTSPIQVSTTNETYWAQVDAAEWITMAVAQDGTLWAWGWDNSGLFGRVPGGYGYTNEYQPFRIGTAADWKSVAVGRTHAVAIKTDGTLWAWGSNYQGQIGDGTTTQRLTPIQIGAGVLGWTAVAVGEYHSLAVATDGTLWTWGINGTGALGNGTLVSSSVPIQVATTISANVTGGQSHSLAIRQDGTLWAWGFNTYGQLGDGTSVLRKSPIEVGE